MVCVFVIVLETGQIDKGKSLESNLIKSLSY